MTNAKKNSTARKASARNSAAKKSAQQPQTGAEQNSDMIAKAAYYKAEERGFMPGYEMQDWLEAEREMDESAV